jgi:hypothetical protein
MRCSVKNLKFQLGNCFLGRFWSAARSFVPAYSKRRCEPSNCSLFCHNFLLLEGEPGRSPCSVFFLLYSARFVCVCVFLEPFQKKSKSHGCFHFFGRFNAKRTFEGEINVHRWLCRAEKRCNKYGTASHSKYICLCAPEVPIPQRGRAENKAFSLRFCSSIRLAD